MNHFLIAGLGNPGERYKNTRHNVGWRILDNYVEGLNLNWKLSGNSIYSRLDENGYVFHFIKPQEYMNLSGKEVSRWSKLYKISPESILIVHDEIDLPFGKIKFKKGGGTAGHNGLKDIVEKLGSSGFHRIRFGVGKPNIPELSVADFVLQNFTKEEEEMLKLLFLETNKRIQDWIQEKTSNKENLEKKV